MSPIRPVLLNLVKSVFDGFSSITFTCLSATVWLGCGVKQTLFMVMNHYDDSSNLFGLPS